MSEEETVDREVDVEEIMQEIRQQIIAKRATTGAGVVAPTGVIVTGKRYPPEFYEHLYEAQLALDDYHVPVFVSKSTTPIIGGLLDWMRGKLHELISYYVNIAVARQAHVSNELLQALSLMGQEEGEPADAP